MPQVGQIREEKRGYLFVGERLALAGASVFWGAFLDQVLAG